MSGPLGRNQSGLGSRHSPRAARSCRCDAADPRPRLAGPAGIHAGASVSGRGCWGAAG